MKKMTSVFKSIDKLATEIPVSEIMTKNPVTLNKDTTVEEAIQVMSDKNISGLLVVDEKNKPIGIVSESDILKKVVSKRKNLKKTTLKDIMTTRLRTINPTLSIGATSVLMHKHDISKFPVVERGKVVGYVAKGDLLEKLNEIYYQNAKLKWMPVFITLLLLVIAILLVLLQQTNLQ